MELATSAEKLEHFQLTHLRGWISMPLIHSDDRAFFLYMDLGMSILQTWFGVPFWFVFSVVLFSQNRVCKIDRRMQIKPKTQLIQLFYLLSLEVLPLWNCCRCLVCGNFCSLGLVVSNIRWRLMALVLGGASPSSPFINSPNTMCPPSPPCGALNLPCMGMLFGLPHRQRLLQLSWNWIKLREKWRRWMMTRKGLLSILCWACRL